MLREKALRLKTAPISSQIDSMRLKNTLNAIAFTIKKAVNYILLTYSNSKIFIIDLKFTIRLLVGSQPDNRYLFLLVFKITYLFARISV